MPMIETNNNGKIGFTIDAGNVIYTTFHNFAGLLTSQGEPQPENFFGLFHTLSGIEVNIPQPI